LSKEIIEVIYGNDLSDLRLIESEIGEIHRYYAENLDPSKSARLDLYLNKVLIGQAVVYWISSGHASIGVVYYVAVDKRFRGRGLGKILVLSSEEILTEKGSLVALATLRSGNKASINLFNSLNYELYSWDHIERSCGADIVDFLLKATCGYEDDYLAIKDLSDRGVGDYICGRLNRLYKDLGREVENHWRGSCYLPWRKLYRS
jgi:GNAT superfamily N-acetyltransferase